MTIRATRISQRMEKMRRNHDGCYSSSSFRLVIVNLCNQETRLDVINGATFGGPELVRAVVFGHSSRKVYGGDFSEWCNVGYCAKGHFYSLCYKLMNSLGSLADRLRGCRRAPKS